MNNYPVFEKIAVYAGLLVYASAAMLPWLNRTRLYQLRLLNLGWILFASAVTIRWIAIGQGPFMTLYEVLLSNLVTLGMIYVMVCSKNSQLEFVSGVVSFFLFLLATWLVTLDPAPVPLPATFENYWLWLHVISGKVFLGFCLISVAVAINLLIQNYLPAVQYIQQKIPSQAETLVWRYFSLAFVAHSCMLLAGSVWAHDAWGSFWAWDPLETWSLITWLSMGIILHLRITCRLPGWSGWLLVNAVFAIAILTFFGMPFFSVAPHKGIV